MLNLLFYCKAPMNAVMFERPLRRLYDDPRFSIQFAGEGRGHGSCESILNSLNFPNARRASNFSVRWRAWDAYISPDISMPARRARRRVQIFHGVSFKGKMYTPVIHRFTDLFLIGEDMRRRFIERGLFEEGDPRLHKVGMPKLDAFFDGSLNKKSILTELGADPDRPAVLYAPTWRPECSLYTQGGVEFIKRCGDGRQPYTLIVKLHDWHWDAATNPIDWRKAIPQLQNVHVRFAAGTNAVPYLFAADALISDASSVANEYLLLNRPILWLNAPALIKKYEKTIDLDGWGRKTGRLVDHGHELESAILDVFSTPDDFENVRRQAAADIFYHPGKATAFFCETLLNLLA